MSNPLKADVELNCEGLNCPTPIIKLKKAVADMLKGQVIRMTATDPGCPIDVRAYTKTTGNELLQSTEENKIHIFYIKKV